MSGTAMTTRNNRPLQLGIQSYTFNGQTYAQALDRAAGLGIRYMEIYPGQVLGGGLAGELSHDRDAATRGRVLEMAERKGITLVSYGVVTPHTEEEWNRVFEFAKALGLRNVSSEPPLELLPLVDRLSRHYGVTVALHNHPDPSLYANPATSQEACKPFGPHLGICADTGHFARSGHDPVRSLAQLQGRLLMCHFKDVDQTSLAGKDVVWGSGVGKATGLIAELRRQDFDGVVLMEYESHGPDREEELQRCVDFFHRANQTPLAELEQGRLANP